jgi:uncharacterized protein (DUF1330 family)
MTVYLVTSFDITDAEKYAPYVPNVMPILKKYGAEIVAADKNAITVDGEERDLTVVIRFPTPESLTELIADPDYTPWMERRLASTTNRATIIVKEFDPAQF